ncbi:MAG: methyltransferase [Promethearchaeota archaeon]
MNYMDNVNNINYFVCDISKDNVPRPKYDVAICSHVLEHLENPKKVLKNIRKIAKKIIIRLPRYEILVYDPIFKIKYS